MARPALETSASVLETGTRVRVRAHMPPGHVRAPSYLRGKSGVIERAVAPFKNPEQLAYGLPAQSQMLYRVGFRMDELWGAEAETPDDVVEAELYAHWIDAEEPDHAP